MKPSDLYLSLQDIIGKILPGLLLILEILYWKNDFRLLATLDEIDRFGSPVNILLGLGAAYVVGTFLATITFGIRNVLNTCAIKGFHQENASGNGVGFSWSNLSLLPRDSLEQFLKSEDKSGRLLAMLEKEFPGLDSSKEHFWPLHFHCKHSLADLAPTGFGLLKRAEAEIGFLVATTVPLFLAVPFAASELGEALGFPPILRWITAVSGLLLLSWSCRSAVVRAMRYEAHLAYLLFLSGESRKHSYLAQDEPPY